MGRSIHKIQKKSSVQKKTRLQKKAQRPTLLTLFPSYRKRAYTDTAAATQADALKLLSAAYRNSGLVLYIGAGVHNCATGNTAAGIPTLEQVLRDNKFTLPPRAG